jgi:phage tail sheath protein FI
LLVRQGNDTSKYPSVLETWYNLSLDPFSPNYIERVIGNQVENLASDGGEYYLDLTGSYANNSKYIRIKSVEKLTPNYLDANGNVRIAAFTGSIPTALSGAFGGAFGSNIPASQAANYYENINGSNTQGLVVAGGTVADYTNAINLLSNKDAYQFKYIVAPGINKNQHSNTVTALLTMVQERGDTMAVVDMEPYGSTVSQTLTDATSLDTSYAATYWPWTQTVDNQTGQPIWTPASTLVPAAYTFSDNASYPWFAPAGTTRGRMSYVTRVERNLTQTNRDNLYVGNVNPLATFPQQGVVIFGQKTLQKQPNALDRVNVRRLLIELINNIGAIANTLVFEQNTQATRNDFLSQVNPYLSSVQQREGVYEFKVVMDESNNTPQTIDNNQLIGQIWIKPTRTAEFISLDFNILPSSATIG